MQLQVIRRPIVRDPLDPFRPGRRPCLLRGGEPRRRLASPHFFPRDCSCHAFWSSRCERPQIVWVTVSWLAAVKRASDALPTALHRAAPDHPHAAGNRFVFRFCFGPPFTICPVPRTTVPRTTGSSGPGECGETRQTPHSGASGGCAEFSGCNHPVASETDRLGSPAAVIWIARPSRASESPGQIVSDER